jgi:hypothetical protein
MMRGRAATWLLASLAIYPAGLVAQDETRWAKVYGDSTETISLDTTTITSLGDSTYHVWERTLSRPSDRVRVLALAEFDCRFRLTRAVAVALPGFQPVAVSSEDHEWTDILPGSAYEAELRWVCSLGNSAGAPR